MEPKCSKISIRRFSQLPLMLMRAGSLPPSSMSRMLAGSSLGAVQKVCAKRSPAEIKRDTKFQQNEDFLPGRYCQWRAVAKSPRAKRGGTKPAGKGVEM